MPEKYPQLQVGDYVLHPVKKESQNVELWGYVTSHKEELLIAWDESTTGLNLYRTWEYVEDFRRGCEINGWPYQVKRGTENADAA